MTVIPIQHIFHLQRNDVELYASCIKPSCWHAGISPWWNYHHLIAIKRNPESICLKFVLPVTQNDHHHLNVAVELIHRNIRNKFSHIVFSTAKRVPYFYYIDIKLTCFGMARLVVNCEHICIIAFLWNVFNSTVLFDATSPRIDYEEAIFTLFKLCKVFANITAKMSSGI